MVDAAVAEHLEVLDLRASPGALPSRSVPSMLTPSSGACAMPFTAAGAGSPAASRMVGATSMTWWNWLRSPPLSDIPLGQCTMVPLRVPPQCDAICLVH